MVLFSWRYVKFCCGFYLNFLYSVGNGFVWRYMKVLFFFILTFDTKLEMVLIVYFWSSYSSCLNFKQGSDINWIKFYSIILPFAFYLTQLYIEDPLWCFIMKQHLECTIKCFHGSENKFLDENFWYFCHTQILVAPLRWFLMCTHNL